VARNEADTLPRLVACADEHLAATRSAHTVIVVDDGSTDGTRHVLSALATARHHLIITRPDAARGHGAALRTGLSIALSTGHEWIAYRDTDGPFDPGDVDVRIGAARADLPDPGGDSSIKAVRRDTLTMGSIG
jgi:glycosyltransferase involved in cell wall biosynthesis